MNRILITLALATSENRPHMDTINRCAQLGDVMFGANKFGHIFAVDVSAPDTIKLPGTRETREGSVGFPDERGPNGLEIAGADDGHDLVCHGGHLFVTGQTSHSLVVVRLSEEIWRLLK
jgi:hypothetical protein